MKEYTAALLGLEKQLRQATTPEQLHYVIVSQLASCVSYTQAVLVTGDPLERAKAVAISDVPIVDHTSPFVLWIERLSRHLASEQHQVEQALLTPSLVPAALADEWRALGLPAYLLWQPLTVEADNHKPAGAVLLLSDSAWPRKEEVICAHLSTSIGHALFALRRRRLLPGGRKRLGQRKVLFSGLGLLLVLMALPIRLTVLAPVEVIADQARIMAAPLDGVVASIKVKPNQEVVPGDVLATMQNSDLSSEVAVAEQALAVARARLSTAQQTGFMRPAEKARLAELDADVALKQSQLEYAQARLERSTIIADSAGVVVLDDPDEWQGRPVTTGERILQIADPNKVAFKINLPVKESIALDTAANVKVFLDSDPLRPLRAKLKHAGYEPRLSAEQQMVYRLTAEPVQDEDRLMGSTTEMPRIGLRGTARIDGQKVTVFFYLFRRPITAARQWIGW